MSGSGHGTVWAVLDLRLAGPGQVSVPLTAGLHYSRPDPYAVRMSFDDGAGEPVVWTFGRELLAAALHAPAGIGDVRAWPAAAPAAAPAHEGAGAGEKILTIELGPPGGRARFEAGAAAIEAFLARTYELVPDGQEPGCLNLDAELAKLLSQA